jgi:ATP-binding cassette, subfamily G (WHITE), member 2
MSFSNFVHLIFEFLFSQKITLAGLLLGAIFMNPKTAQTVAAVLMLTIILTGGFFVVDIPSWIGWLKWFSYVYYALGTFSSSK